MRQRPADPTISIVIPAKNEGRNLRSLLRELPQVHEVILVDGHSSDDTIEVARAILPEVRILTQTRRGKGNALACGFAAAMGDIIVMIDADCSADPAEIPRFVDALLAGADMAKGSRFRDGGGSADITRVRALGNCGLNTLANIIFGTRYTDLCYGYNAFWADIRPEFDLPDPGITALSPQSSMIWGDGFEIETLMNCRTAAAGLSAVEVASFERLRAHGTSNLNAFSDGLRVLKTLNTERRRAARLRRYSGTAIPSGSAGDPVATPETDLPAQTRAGAVDWRIA
jgi:glycosyltransferase involved in cell wall biosynthesis